MEEGCDCAQLDILTTLLEVKREEDQGDCMDQYLCSYFSTLLGYKAAAISACIPPSEEPMVE